MLGCHIVLDARARNVLWRDCRGQLLCSRREGLGCCLVFIEGGLGEVSKG